MSLRASLCPFLSAILTAALLTACAGEMAAPADYVEQIGERRARLDRKTREGTATPFTPVGVRMIATGETVVAGLCDGTIRFDPEGPCEGQVRLRYTSEGFLRVTDSGDETEARGMLPLGRFRLSLSRQEDRGRILVHDPQSEAQRGFQALRWYPPDPAYRFVVRVEPYPEETPARMTTTAGLVKTFRRYGRVTFAVAGREHSLSVYLPEGAEPSDPSAFFIPFRDATSGDETYAVGRYASLSEAEDGWVLDFNMAGSPNCAYNPYWNCPIPPRENRLSIPIRAGELVYLPHGADHP